MTISEGSVPVITTTSATTLAIAALCLGVFAASPAANAQGNMAYETVTNAPRVSNGTYGGWSAAANVRQSMRYDRLLETSMGFRRFRARRECGPINDPQLRQDCFGSFAQYEPFVGRRAFYGSGMPPYIDPPYTAGQ